VEFRQAVAETGPFGRRCLSILPCSPFPLPAHQTGRADFPHPAFRSGFNVTPSAKPSSHIQTGLAVPHAILVARPLANRRAFQPFHRRPESEAPSLHGRYPFLCCRVGGGAPCGADLRPPPKLDVQISRIQLSQW
jgi:hypothetical protein